jgi:hypothetical protein
MIRRLVVVLVVLVSAVAVRAGEIPPGLPVYDLTMDLDVAGHVAKLTMRATWTNNDTVSAKELVFNNHAHYVLPDKEVGLVAKTLEIFRVTPSEALGVKEPPLEVDKVWLPGATAQDRPVDLAFRHEGDTNTTLVVPLPFEVKPGQTVTIVLDMTMHLPQKQGRWGQWRDVTFLSNWLPVFAVRGEAPPPPPKEGKDESVSEAKRTYDLRWQPTPFIPWHQPFFNEAGHYRVHVTLPCEQNVGCTGTITSRQDLPDGRRRLEITADGVRDFAFLCSARYQEWTGLADIGPGHRPVPVHVLALPEHEFFAKEAVRIACESLTSFSEWFGPYAYPDFTVAEGFFGWGGNQCGALVMIDERLFSMPHLASDYVELVLSHETCHQWWYNAVGVNGYCETWMDEGLATYFCHRRLDRLKGRDHRLMNYPRGLEWLPNIRREDYRAYSFYGTLGRGENGPCVQPIPGFDHVVNLFSMAYDKGSRIVGMIEDRMGEQAFMSFMRRVYQRYEFRILRVADFQRELEEYTGQSWEAFFRDWLYGKGLCDWSIEKVEVHNLKSEWKRHPLRHLAGRLFGPAEANADISDPATCKVVVHLHQKAEYDEVTSLGIAMPCCDGYAIRIPILPQSQSYTIESPPARVDVLEKGHVRVEVDLPAEPVQMAVDPDQVLVDKNPANNFWKAPIRWRLTPVYTFLEETDLTNAYDRWNVICGPWIYGAAYDDPWYTRSMMIGLRTGVYRTQHFVGGAYAAYRTDFRDVVVGVDGLWDHCFDPHWQFGFNAERRLWSIPAADDTAFRGVLFGRYVFQYGDSLYLPPMHYLEAFTCYTDNFLPFAKHNDNGAERFDLQTTAGLHYRLDYLTPYWDPEGGIRIDAVCEAGMVDLHHDEGVEKFALQASTVYSAPNLYPHLSGLPGADAMRPVLDWFADTRLAVRAYGAVALPTRGEFYSLGGGDLFRGFDLTERQGDAVWVGSVEWRVPLAKGLHYDIFDHVLGLRNVYGAVFCDVGDAYIHGHSIGPVAYAVGGGLRFDVAWFAFVERTLLRVDVAKAVNADTGVQVWFDVQVPF